MTNSANATTIESANRTREVRSDVRVMTTTDAIFHVNHTTVSTKTAM
jgi:hypothetical protein